MDGRGRPYFFVSGLSLALAGKLAVSSSLGTSSHGCHPSSPPTIGTAAIGQGKECHAKVFGFHVSKAIFISKAAFYNDRFFSRSNATAIFGRRSSYNKGSTQGVVTRNREIASVARDKEGLILKNFAAAPWQQLSDYFHLGSEAGGRHRSLVGELNFDQLFDPVWSVHRWIEVQISRLGANQTESRQMVSLTSLIRVIKQADQAEDFDNESSTIKSESEIFKKYAAPALNTLTGLIEAVAGLFFIALGWSGIQFRAPRDWSDRLRNVTLLASIGFLLLGGFLFWLVFSLVG
jgi:hypothetical protein